MNNTTIIFGVIAVVIVGIIVSFGSKKVVQNAEVKKTTVRPTITAPHFLDTTNSASTSGPTSPEKSDLSEWQYPNSKVQEESSNSITLESTETTNTITEWYKEKIREKGLRTNTFVSTNTNGNILNKLAGSNEDGTVRVEITRKNGSNAVIIVVSKI